MPDLDADLIEAGKRASNTVNEMIAQHGWWNIRTGFIAIHLRDGSCDKVIYETKRDAVRHQIDERLCAYLCLRGLAKGTNAYDMAVFLQYNRKIYDAGYRLPDPDDVFGGPSPAMSNNQYEQIKRELTLPMLDEALRRTKKELGIND